MGKLRGQGWRRAGVAAISALGCSTRPVGDHPGGAPLAGDTALTAPSAAPASAPSSAPSSLEVNPRMLRRFRPLPAEIAGGGAVRTSEKVDLGRMLYFDPRLSRGGEISCNSCHPLDDYGTDHKAVSIGDAGHAGERNAPTTYNAAGHFAQFWDGRAPDVEAQARVPILNPVEMAMPDEARVVATLERVPGYVEAFRAAFPGEADPVTVANVGRAIGAFERGLLTPSRWDDYLRGERSALTAAEKEGLKTFLNVGCMVCHTGTFVGGATFERVGVVEPWPNQRDLGRERVTHAPADAMVFKVPSLRNVARTAPYFHDGSATTLQQAVRMMARHQLGLELPEPQVDAIVAWLKSLTGDPPRDYVKPPTLPPSKT